MKKKLTSVVRSMVCLLATVGFIACEDTNYVYVSKAKVGLTPSTDIVFTNEGGERTIAVRTNQKEWTVYSDQDWCKVVPTSDGDGFVVSALPNSTIQSLPEATITVKTSADQLEDNFATMSLKVNQTGFNLIDLSAEGCANCYVVSEAGYYKFDARVQGKSGLPTASDFSSCSADWIWATQEGLLVLEPKVENGYISFVCSDFKPGNAVVALVEGGKVVWSWHIWFTDQVLEARERNMMCVNLGAVSDLPGEVSQFGLFYQWGRKDPFVASSGVGHYPDQVISSNEEIAFAQGEEDGVSYTAANIVNTNLVSDWNVSKESDAHTHSTASAAATTFFTAIKALPNYGTEWTGESDPCPPGWRLPTRTELGNYFSGSNSTISWEDYKGVIRGKDWIPAQGYRNFQNGRLTLIGRSGWVWNSETNPYDLMTGFNYAIGFEEGGYARTNIMITYGFNVRCAKE